jgi:hypothetical protein
MLVWIDCKCEEKEGYIIFDISLPRRVDGRHC